MLLAAFVRHFDADELQHVQFAWLIGQGYRPFVDFYEHHTPLLHYAMSVVTIIARPEASAAAAVGTLLALRVLAAAVGVAVLLVTYRLGSTWKDRATGGLGALMLGSTGIFLQKSIEIRPDTAGVLLWLSALWLLSRHVQMQSSARHSQLLLVGFLTGCAISTNVKIILAAPALLLGLLASPVGAVAALALGALGTAVGLVPLVILLAQSDSLSAFWRAVVLGSMKWTGAIAPWHYLEQLWRENPELIALGLIGFTAFLVLAAARRSPRDEAWAAVTRMIVGSAFFPVAGLFLMPEPWRQYFLIFLPSAAILAAGVLVETIEASARATTRSQLVRAVVLTASGVLLTVLSLPETSRAKMVPRRNKGQLAEIGWLVSNSPPDAKVLSGWLSQGVFRSPAVRWTVLPYAWLRQMTPDDRAEIVSLLASCRTRPEIVFFDDRLASVDPQVPALVQQWYEPVGIGRAWRKRGGSCAESEDLTRLSARSIEPG